MRRRGPIRTEAEPRTIRLPDGGTPSPHVTTGGQTVEEDRPAGVPERKIDSSGTRRRCKREIVNLINTLASFFAWAVHLYTATGVLFAFLALDAIVANQFQAAFVWLFIATFVDATDGWLARLADVRSRTPGFDGARLDEVVDYLTYVFVPAVLMFRAGLLPGGWAVAVAASVLLASAYGFGRADAKSDDYFFTGFPSYWNIVALYLFALALPPAVNAAILLALSGMVFVPVGYVYPSRTPALRGLTVMLCSVWGVLMAGIIATLPEPPGALLAASLFFPIYYTALSVVLNARRVRHG
jgi:phosphatidylcholine synthase